jgi:hypothetical protein
VQGMTGRGRRSSPQVRQTEHRKTRLPGARKGGRLRHQVMLGHAEPVFPACASLGIPCCLIDRHRDEGTMHGCQKGTEKIPILQPKRTRRILLISAM